MFVINDSFNFNFTRKLLEDQIIQFIFTYIRKLKSLVSVDTNDKQKKFYIIINFISSKTTSI